LRLIKIHQNQFLPLTAEVGLELVKKEYISGDTTGKQILGAGGTEFFRFKTLKSGETKITFTYYRPWETPTDQDQTRIFTVDIK
jgi:predicted secreted protein